MILQKKGHSVAPKDILSQIAWTILLLLTSFASGSSDRGKLFLDKPLIWTSCVRQVNHQFPLSPQTVSTAYVSSGEVEMYGTTVDCFPSSVWSHELKFESSPVWKAPSEKEMLTNMLVPNLVSWTCPDSDLGMWSGSEWTYVRAGCVMHQVDRAWSVAAGFPWAKFPRWGYEDPWSPSWKKDEGDLAGRKDKVSWLPFWSLFLWYSPLSLKHRLQESWQECSHMAFPSISFRLRNEIKMIRSTACTVEDQSPAMFQQASLIFIVLGYQRCFSKPNFWTVHSATCRLMGKKGRKQMHTTFNSVCN